MLIAWIAKERKTRTISNIRQANMTKMEIEDFNLEMKEYVLDIVQNEFTNIDINELMTELHKEVKGETEDAHDEVIYEVIERLGGEPHDPSVEEDDYEEEADEGDY